MSHPQTRPRQASNQGPRPAAQGERQQEDYVYFDRSTTGFSAEAVPKAKAAQLKLEHFYKLAVDAAVERNTRHVSHVWGFHMLTRSSHPVYNFDGASNSHHQTCGTGTKARCRYLTIRREKATSIASARKERIYLLKIAKDSSWLG